MKSLLTFYKCGSELLPAAVWSASGSSSLFSDLNNNNNNNKREINPLETAKR